MKINLPKWSIPGMRPSKAIANLQEMLDNSYDPIQLKKGISVQDATLVALMKYRHDFEMFITMIADENRRPDAVAAAKSFLKKRKPRLGEYASYEGEGVQCD